MVESYANHEDFDESNYFRKPCRYFTRFGFCLEPDTCEYNHTKPEPIPAPYVTPLPFVPNWNPNPKPFVPNWNPSPKPFVPNWPNWNPSPAPYVPIDINDIPTFDPDSFIFPEFGQVEQ